MRFKFGNGMSVAIAGMALLCTFAAYAEKITLTIDPCMPQLQTQVFQVEACEWSEWILWPADDAIEGYRLGGWSSTGSYSSSSKYEGGDRYYRFRCSDDCTIRFSWQWKDTETHYSYDKTTGYSWAFKTLSPMEAQIIGLVNKTDGVLRIPNVVTDNESGQSYAIVEVGGGSRWHDDDDEYFALSELTAITAVVFSPSVRIVRSGAFDGCKNLATITWSTGLEEVECYAFSNTALKEVTLPDSLTSCDLQAFTECPELTKLVFSSRRMGIDEWSEIYDCPKLKTLALPKEVYCTWDDDVCGLFLWDLDALEVLDVPEGVGEISIIRCPELASVSLPSSLMGIRNSEGDSDAMAFAGCWKLEKVVFNGDVPVGGRDFHAGSEGFANVLLWANSIYYPMQYRDHWEKVLRNSGYGGVTGAFAAADSAKMLQMVADAPKYATEQVPDFGPYVVGIEGAQVDSSLAGFSMTSVPAGLTWNEKSGTLSGTARNPGEFEVAMSDGVSSFSATIQVDPSPKGTGGGARFHELIPGEKVEIDTGLDVGYKAVGLPTGLKYDAKTGKITGAATKPTTAEGVVVKFTKSGAETEELTIIVTAIPTLKVAMEGDVDGCKVTGAGAYLVGKKVTLKVTTKKGTAFLGYYKGEEPWPNASDYKKTSLSYEMTRDDVSVVAKFEKEKMSVGCTGLEGYFVAGVAGAVEGIPLQIETQSGVKSVKVSKLPAGMKYDSKTGLITGAPTKAENPTVVIEVTAVSGAVEKKEIPVRVIAPNEKAVGLFSGFATKDSLQDFNRVGTILLTTTTAGKLTVKIVTKKGSLSFSAASWDGIRDSYGENDGVYFVTMKTKKGEELALELDTRANVGVGANQLTGWLKGVDAEDLRIGAQHVVFGQPWYFTAVGDETQGWKLSYTADKKAAALTVTFKADGSVTIAGKLGACKVSASGYANVSDLPSELLRADFVVAVKVGSQNRMLNVNTDLRFDRTYAPDEAGEAAFAE